MQYLNSNQWPHNYTVHDIGFSYPNATGHNNGTAEEMPVEECGNIILLAYMYQLASGNTDWIKGYSSLFGVWADYLVINGLYPTTQLSTDDGAGSTPNQTNLAIKSAIALNAYGIMTSQPKYSDTGKSFAHTLYNDAVGTDPSRTHFTLIQGQSDTWTTAFNLYPDILLNLSTFPNEAYEMQSAYYKQIRSPAGVALDSSESWGKTDWMIWAAATAAKVGDTETRDMFLNDVHGLLTNSVDANWGVPISDKFFVEANQSAGDVQGAFSLYKARPVVGGHFALLALQGAGVLG